MKRSEISQIIREEYSSMKLEEGVLSWISGAADDMIHGILNGRHDIQQSNIFSDPKLAKLARDLKMDKKEFQSRVSQLLNKDSDFLKALSTQRSRRYSIPR